MRQHLQYVKSRIIEVGWNNCHRLHGSTFGRRSLPFAFIFRWPSFLCFSQARASRRNVLASTGTDAAMRYRSGCRIMSDGVGGEELSAFYVPRPPRRNFCRLLSVHRLRRKHGKHGENGTHDTFRLTCHDILLSLKTPGHRSLVTLQIPPLAQTRSWEHSEWVTCRKDNWIWIGKNGMGHHGTKAWRRWYPLVLSPWPVPTPGHLESTHSACECYDVWTVDWVLWWLWGMDPSAPKWSGPRPVPVLRGNPMNFSCVLIEYRYNLKHRMPWKPSGVPVPNRSQLPAETSRHFKGDFKVYQLPQLPQRENTLTQSTPQWAAWTLHPSTNIEPCDEKLCLLSRLLRSHNLGLVQHVEKYRHTFKSFKFPTSSI